MWITIAVLLSMTNLSFNMVHSLNFNDSLSCETYNGLTCKSESKDECVTQETCGPEGPEEHYHCFTLWEYNVYKNTSTVQMKGCFLNHEECFKQSHCIQKNKDEINQLFFCCCGGNMCNQNITYTMYLKNRQKTATVEVKTKHYTMPTEEKIIIFMCTSTLSLAATLSIVAWCLYKCAKQCGNHLSKAEEGLNYSMTTSSPQTPHQHRDHIACTELLEKKAHGRYGSVWLARHRGYREALAVKVFPLSGRESWLSELRVFRLPGLQHDNLLHLIAAGRRGQGLDTEFWLVTTYYEKGSLCDFLMDSLISWSELYRIAIGMLSGLEYLHREIGQPNSSVPVYKPAIAHRDFKSKNVLLSGDMRACIADLGLALVFEPMAESDVVNEQQQKQRFGRAGTPRYMAPEVLDGAVEFGRIDAYRATDVYACALVLWELMSRCSDMPDINIEYELPFERELGPHATMGHIYDYVVEENGRPFIPDSWREQPGSTSICEIIEDCWDKDADARLSSACMLDRIKVLEDDYFDIMDQSIKNSCKCTSL